LSLFPRTRQGFWCWGRARLRQGAIWAAAGLSLSLGCTAIQDPFPTPLPPNLLITPSPARDARVDPAATQRVRLAFDQPMDRSSVQQVSRVSFLIPVALRDLDGIWSAGDSAVEFDLTQFPTQPGALYEARFTGLRTAAGVLYNGGPFELRFETTGIPDLLPLRPHPRVATRNYCRRSSPASAPCVTTTLRSDSIGTDSLRTHFTCEDCVEGRDDFFHGRPERIEWLGWDDTDLDDAVVRRVRWPTPPPLVATRTRTGDVLEGAAQTAPSGVQLLRWRSTNRGPGSPSQAIGVVGGTLEIVYSRATMIDLDYALRIAGVEETHLERWWLLPGVGLVRREARIERDGNAPRTTIESFVPSLANFGVN